MANGQVAMDSFLSGDPVEPACPMCSGQCVYNGNYFCVECGWALPHGNPEADRPNSRFLCEWSVEAYFSLMDFRGIEPQWDLIDPDAETWKW